MSACICLQCGRPGFDSGVRKIPWRRKWQIHSSILTWRIPWTEEPGGVQSTGSQRAGHDWAHFHFHILFASTVLSARVRSMNKIDKIYLPSESLNFNVCLDSDKKWRNSMHTTLPVEKEMYIPKLGGGFPRWLSRKESTCQEGHLGLIPRLGGSHGEGNGYSIIFTWEIPRTEELDGLRSMELQRVGHDLATTPPPPPPNWEEGRSRGSQVLNVYNVLLIYAFTFSLR